MKYRVVVTESAEGFSVSAPALPGCHSQGGTRDQALANIADAIREYLEAGEEERLPLFESGVVESVEV